MAWMHITDEARPEDGEFVEVELTNGTIQLAQYAQGKWVAPATAKEKKGAEFNGVIKWRLFAEAKAAAKKPAGSSYGHYSNSTAA